MEKEKLFAVNVQGMLSAEESFIVSGYTEYHALDKAHSMFYKYQSDRNKYSVLKKRSVKAKAIINKF